jgi:hypothetical protein
LLCLDYKVHVGHITSLCKRHWIRHKSAAFLVDLLHLLSCSVLDAGHVTMHEILRSYNAVFMLRVRITAIDVKANITTFFEFEFVNTGWHLCNHAFPTDRQQIGDVNWCLSHGLSSRLSQHPPLKEIRPDNLCDNLRDNLPVDIPRYLLLAFSAKDHDSCLNQIVILVNQIRILSRRLCVFL